MIITQSAGMALEPTNVRAQDVRLGKTAYSGDGELITGTMPEKSAAVYTPGTTDQIINSGQYLIGNQTILGSADLIAENIKKDVNIFNITGTYEGNIVWQHSYTDLASLDDEIVFFNITSLPKAYVLYLTGTQNSINMGTTIILSIFNFVDTEINNSKITIGSRFDEVVAFRISCFDSTTSPPVSHYIESVAYDENNHTFAFDVHNCNFMKGTYCLSYLSS